MNKFNYVQCYFLHSHFFPSLIQFFFYIVKYVQAYSFAFLCSFGVNTVIKEPDTMEFLGFCQPEQKFQVSFCNVIMKFYFVVQILRLAHDPGFYLSVSNFHNNRSEFIGFSWHSMDCNNLFCCDIYFQILSLRSLCLTRQFIDSSRSCLVTVP